MSGGTVCTCEQSRKPLAERDWFVTQRNCNHSTFNGGRRTYSRYSAIRCEACRANWRTTAKYVAQLRDAS